MRANCQISSLEVLDWIDGVSANDLAPHVAECPKCAQRVESCRRIKSQLSERWFEPSADCIAEAQKLAKGRKVVRAIRLGISPLQQVQVRGEASLKELMFARDADGAELKLHYVEEGKQWKIRIKGPAGAPYVIENEVIAADEAGWVVANVASLAHDDIYLMCGDQVVEIPNPLSDDPDRNP